jgi:serine/threonine protein kinase/formylglycine-generating enzyme required for sulfatase activity
VSREEQLQRVLQEFVDRRARGEEPSVAEYLDRYPEIREELLRHFSVWAALDRLVAGKTTEPPRETVLGDFRILREIGRGAWGVVFLAEQVSLHRLVALKVLGAPLAQSYRTVERFRREAEIAARLRHPNLVAVYATGEGGGYCYYAMEYVRGVTLSHVLQRLRERDIRSLGDVDLLAMVRETASPDAWEGLEGETPRPEVLRHAGYFGAVARIASEIADGLAYAHGKGVTHRDVKPQNILLDVRGTPQIADFGLAKEVGQESLSITGDLMGTPYYMSPEVAMAGRIKADHRTDIYSLGVTLFEMLTLAVPFTGRTSQEVLRRILFEPPPSPRRLNPAIPRDLQVIVLKAMEKDPDHRYGSAAEFAEDLRRFLRFEPIHARPPGAMTVTMRYLKRHRAGALATAATVVAAFGVVLALRAEARAARLGAELASAEASLEAGDLGAAERQFERIVAARPESDRARAGLEATERRIEEEVSRLTREGEGHLERKEYSHAARAFERAFALREEARLRALVDEAHGLFPLAVTSEPSGAQVFLHPVDEVTGRVLTGSEVGSTPLTLERLPLGRYRIVVEKEGFGFGEYSVEVRRQEESRALHAPLRPTREVIQGMVPVPGGVYPVGREVGVSRAVGFVLLPQQVSVPAFYIDPNEVTNGEYARFVEATGHRPPRTWPGPLPPEGQGRIPVSGVDWKDAKAYAEWAGKRLPTEVEWEIACRGPSGNLYPWGNEPVEGAANLGTIDRTLAEGAVSIAVPIMGSALAVGSKPGDCTSLGIFDLAGNLEEWVWDPWASRAGFQEDDPRSASPENRVLRGGSFASSPSWGGRCTDRGPALAGQWDKDVGFRCAKSARP